MDMKERLKRDSEKADSVLSVGTPALSTTASVTESTPVSSLVASAPSSVTPAQVVPSVSGSIASTPASVTEVPASSVVQSSSDITALQTQVSNLQNLLNDENSNTFKSRYLTLQGLYKKQGEDINALKQQVAEIAKKPEESTVQFNSETLAKLKEDYGDDIEGVINHLVKEGINKAVSKDLKAVGDRIEKVEDTTAVTAGNTFLSDLDREVPGWKQINGWTSEGIPQDPKWAAFLNQSAPATGKTYDELLNGHYSNLNLAQVKQIFDIYKSTQAPIAPVPEPIISAAISSAVVPNIENFVDPNAGGGGGVPPAPDKTKQTYTRAEIDKFFADVTKGHYKDRPEERAKLEKEYQDAMVSGRVR